MPVYNADYIETVQHKSLATDLEKLGIFGKRRKLVGSINAYRKYLAAHDLHQALIEEEKQYQVKAKKTIDPKSIMCLQDEIEMSLLKLGKKAVSFEDFELANTFFHEGLLPGKRNAFIVANAKHLSELHIPIIKKLITQADLDDEDVDEIRTNLLTHYSVFGYPVDFADWLRTFHQAKTEKTRFEAIKTQNITPTARKKI
ncbi:hypothetical protein [Paraburkholderia tropica]|uniref:hypothetical protein n=1 Tax=Paraburkholderia tropica TaxID=92647 RepID=UPI003D268FFE